MLLSGASHTFILVSRVYIKLFNKVVSVRSRGYDAVITHGLLQVYDISAYA